METVKNIQANNMNHNMNQIEVPVTEPQRQFYFMDLAKQLIKEREKQCGHRLTFHVETFGCPTV